MAKKPILSTAEVKTLVQKYGAPLYVYRKSVIEKRYRDLVRSIPYPNKKIFYACKANTNLEVMRHLRKLGSSIETVSLGEVHMALKAGFPPSRISYTCSNVSSSELLAVMREGVRVHLDSLNQIKWWGEMHPRSNISLRINRGFGAGAHLHIITGGPDSKFGIYYTDLPKALALAKKYGLRITGLQQHIGSNILDTKTFIKAMGLILQTAQSFPNLESIDIGGGLGIPYRPEAKPLNLQKLGKAIAVTFKKFCKKYGRELELGLEPGRYIVAESGALLVKVVDRKETPKHSFVGVDSGFNHLIRPAFYGSYHHIFNMSNPRGKVERVTIAGNMCESSDIFAAQRPLPKARIGDTLLFADAGAYGYTMSSNYNSRPKPREIVVD